MGRLVRAGIAGCMVALLAACGGGGGGSDAPPPSGGSGAPGGGTGGTGGATPSGGGASANPPRIEPYEMVARTAQARSAAAPSTLNPAVVQLPAPADALLVKAKAAAASAGKGVRRQIGQARAVAATADVAAMARRLDWQPASGGGLAAATSFRSEGAASVRVGLLVQRLPDQATVRVFAPGGADLAAFSGAQIRSLLSGPDAKSLTYWLPAVGGPEAVLEIALPAGVAPSQVEVAVPQLSHLWVDLARGEDSMLKIGESDTCNIDASCEASYLDESRAVARMEFVSAGDSFLCTGTLMADAAATGTPWFLSANHCISDQASASSLTTYWFYRSASCGSRTLSPGATRLTGGAQLLYATATTDTAFLRLVQSPPTGALFAGSLLAAPAVGAGVVGLHHPVGDLLKFSQGSILAFSNCSENAAGDVSCGTAGDRFFSVRWSRGTTQRGSSGSAMFSNVGERSYVSGHLYAGLASCQRPSEADYYGRFDIPYRSALYQWLGDVPGAR